MIVTDTLAKDLAYTNFAYCSPTYLRKFLVPGFKFAYGLLADAFILTLAYPFINSKNNSDNFDELYKFLPPEDFNLALLTLDLEFVKKGTKDEQVDAVSLANQFRKIFANQIMSTGQKVTFEYHGNGNMFTVNQATLERQEKSNIERGMVSADTYIIFEAANSSGIKAEKFNLQALDIGGLGAEFFDIFRRAFVSRGFPPHVTSNLGIKHVKGMLLFELPGTGKTPMARQIGKMLNGKEPKIVNGPEVLSKFVGETEKNVRDLFADAEQDQKTKGDQSELHVIIFDEIDAICKLHEKKNYSVAELEGVIKSAVSYALNRQLSMDDLTKPVDEESIKVTMDEFLHALNEVRPAFGASTDDLERCRLNGIVDCGERHQHIYRRTMLLAEQVKVSRGAPLITCLLEGPSGSGKTAMAATVGIRSDFPYVKIISAETMTGLSESSKCAQIVKVFEDAYKSPLSIVVLDGMERLLEYVAIGPRFSNLISQTLMVLLKRFPPKGKKILGIVTTSEVSFLDSVGLCDAFSVTYHVPTLKTEDAEKVLQQLNVFSSNDVDSAVEALNDMPIKKLYMVVEMAVQGENAGTAEAIYSGKEKINISHFYDCLQDIVRY
ncbi:unnamed protein product [Withania somnifera]